MEFLKAEIERKKRQMQEKGVMAGPDKKYFKRGDLAEKQREEYLAKHSPKSDTSTKSEEMKVNTQKGKKNDIQILQPNTRLLITAKVLVHLYVTLYLFFIRTER